MFGKIKKVESFERVTLRESGMRYTIEYEMVPKDGQAELTLYAIRFGDQEDRRVPEQTAVIPVQEALDLMNTCRLMSWDGFQGRHPRGVLDGIMFSMKAVVNDNRSISASGSENFPKQYRIFTDGMRRILSGETK